MPRVLNKYKDKQNDNSVYIGRPTKWGNPFPIEDGDREECLRKYKEYLYNNTELMEQAKNELVGKDLVCFCAPKLCHGDVLLEVANESKRIRHRSKRFYTN